MLHQVSISLRMDTAQKNVRKQRNFFMKDHGHLLKRLTNTLRQGHMTMMDMRRFAEVLKDADTGLTKQALAGDRKQSVSDCERLWSRGVLEFMERKGNITEFNVVKVVRNWHRAVDGGGLSEQERSTFVKDMLNGY